MGKETEGKEETPGQKDPEKGRIRTDWQAKGPSWDRWADVVGETADRLNDPLVDAAGVARGETVLDLASGTGEPALNVARRVGADGLVVATDLAEEMLAGARRRAAAAGLAHLGFAVADMEALPFPGRRFDRVTCRFGIMFCPRPERALAEARRVLAPGGRAAFLVWGPVEDVTMFTVISGASERVLGESPWHDSFDPFRFAAPGALAAVMSAAGFAEVEETELRLLREAPIDEPFWRPYLEMALAPRLGDLEPARRRELEAAIIAGFEACRSGDVYRLAVHVRVVAGSPC